MTFGELIIVALGVVHALHVTLSTPLLHHLTDLDAEQLERVDLGQNVLVNFLPTELLHNGIEPSNVRDKAGKFVVCTV